MNNSILESMFNGEIKPFELKISRNPERCELETQIKREKNYFKETMTSEDYERLEVLEALYSQSCGGKNIEFFAHGYTTATQIMIEVINRMNGIT
jgi:hypothetical protein